jgi:hypothetical protein
MTDPVRATPTEAAEATAQRLTYRLISGPDDVVFCQRVGEALADGYRLYGSPTVTFDGTNVIAAQAVVLDIAIDNKGALR